LSTNVTEIFFAFACGVAAAEVNNLTNVDEPRNLPGSPITPRFPTEMALLCSALEEETLDASETLEW
jgi:hypothetical protein